MMPSQSALATIRKNALEEIRVGLSEFNGHDLLNIRIWTDPRNGGSERIPTKAGIACRVALLPEIIEALQQAEAQARARGLLWARRSSSRASCMRSNICGMKMGGW